MLAHASEHIVVRLRSRLLPRILSCRAFTLALFVGLMQKSHRKTRRGLPCWITMAHEWPLPSTQHVSVSNIVVRLRSRLLPRILSSRAFTSDLLVSLTQKSHRKARLGSPCWNHRGTVVHEWLLQQTHHRPETAVCHSTRTRPICGVLSHGPSSLDLLGREQLKLYRKKRQNSSC